MSAKLNEIIAETIRKKRIEKGYSQEFVASKLRITQQAYAVIEKNPENSSIKRLCEISTILEIELVEMLGLLSKMKSCDCLPASKPNAGFTTQLTLNINGITNLDDLEQLIQFSKRIIEKEKELKRQLE